MSQSEFCEDIARQRQRIGQVIKKHVEKMSSIAQDRETQVALRELPKHLDELGQVAIEKMLLSQGDGRGHSQALQFDKGGPMISVSCWPCALVDLKGFFRRQLGNYEDLLPQYVSKAESIGASAFIHVFVCYDERNESLGVTMCYAGITKRELITPNELLDPRLFR